MMVGGLGRKPHVAQNGAEHTRPNGSNGQARPNPIINTSVVSSTAIKGER